MIFLTGQGFLPFRASFVLDFIFVAMFAICIVLIVSIFLVRGKGFGSHRKIQLGLSVLLLVAIIIFEVDIRFFSDWRSMATPSRFYKSGAVDMMLWIHLFFAIPTPFVWGWVVYRAIKRFPTPPQPNEHSPEHKFWGWVATVMMFATAITGCTFYWMAFAM